MLTFLPLEQMDEMDKWEGSQLNQAKEILAYELTGPGSRRGRSEKSTEWRQSSLFQRKCGGYAYGGAYGR
jgi:hypothetical protein